MYIRRKKGSGNLQGDVEANYNLGKKRQTIDKRRIAYSGALSIMRLVNGRSSRRGTLAVAANQQAVHPTAPRSTQQHSVALHSTPIHPVAHHQPRLTDECCCSCCSTLIIEKLIEIKKAETQTKRQTEEGHGERFSGNKK